MRILIIEDSPKHTADCQKIANNYPIVAHFAKTYDEAMKLLKENEYDGIISDIFFPRNEKQEFPTSIVGWHSIISSKCYSILKDFGIGYDGYEEYVKAAEKWIKGKAMHPAGVIIADMALNNKIPVVLCTDTFHHGYQTQPVYSWARKNKVSIVDCEPDDLYTGSAPKKNWGEALQRLLEKINYKRQKEERRNYQAKNARTHGDL